MKLYEFKRTRSYKCRWLIKELGAPCEFIEINLIEGEHMKPEFLAINPWGKVPALVDGDFKLFEASAICIYLADKFSAQGLIPAAGTQTRAVCNKWLFFMANELECHLWSMEKNTWGYREDKRSKTAIESAEYDFKKAIKVIDAEFKNNKSDYLIDNKFGVADISLSYLLRWARGRQLLADVPDLDAYLNRQIEREYYPREIFEG